MNQRMGHRASHAAMPFGQRVKRRNGGRVAQHDGNLPAFLAQGCLTLSAGLGLVHSSGKLAHEVHALDVRLPAGQLGGDETATLFAGGGDGELTLLNRDSDHIPRLGANGLGKGAALGNYVHSVLPSGPIPPMGESYAVTSDTSIPSRKDFLEAA